MSKLNQFSDLSLKLTKKILSTDEKKNNGIFFTPLDIIKLTISIINDNANDNANDNDNDNDNKTEIKKVLEPSCGSCEFINYMDSIYNNLEITAIEYNQTIFNNIKDIKIKNNSLNLFNEDYLKFDIENKNLYDLIIGNPPYYVITDTKKEMKKYKEYYDGRTNIFILFIIHSLKKLEVNGILAFVLPKNFLNCQYYNKLRSHIYYNYKIINIIDCSSYSYIETTQDTIIFIIRNNKKIISNTNFAISKSDNIIFNSIDNTTLIKELYLNSTTLHEMKFEVNVGKIVWNQHKNILTDDTSKTRLIYSSDIINNNLIQNIYKNQEKKNYIDKPGYNNLLLVVNRGYGKGEYKFNYCLIDITQNYLIENHLICIKYKNDIDKEELKKLYEIIIRSFQDERTSNFIKLYFGNNAINTNELEYYLPIYI
jgi:adenine-specific DNA-methyltransferase